MDDLVQVHAYLSRELKLRAFSALARRDYRFTQWLKDTLESWLKQVEQSQQTQQGSED